MKHARILLVTMAMGLVSVSGCLGGDDGATDVDLPEATDIDPEFQAEDGRDLRVALLEDDILPGPEWEIGESFGHHVFLGADDDEGIHINTIVVEDRGDSWFLATDDTEMAWVEGAFDIPILGEFKKSDLSTTGFGSAWDWMYEFPMSHEKTWTGTVYVPDFETGEAEGVSTTFTATYNAGVTTSQGVRPGFDIEGVTAEGDVLVTYNYVPAVAWYSHFWMWDLATEDPDDFYFHVMDMGHEKNWTGTYYVTEAVFATNHMNFVGAEVNPDDPAQVPEVYTDLNPYATFTIADTATHMYGFAFSGAFAGAHATVLVDPNNEVIPLPAAGAPFEFTEFEFYEEAVAGTWTIATVGAGVTVFGGAMIIELTEDTRTL